MTQTIAIEDLLVEGTLYVEDPVDLAGRESAIAGWTFGRKVGALRTALRNSQLLDRVAHSTLARLDRVVEDRNVVAHGVLIRRPTTIVPIAELTTDLVLEWVLLDRRSGEAQEVTMSWLRSLVHESQSAFLGLLGFFELLVERAPVPQNFQGGTFIAVPRDA